MVLVEKVILRANGGVGLFLVFLIWVLFLEVGGVYSGYFFGI
jgi:hypothetical protein